MNVSSRVPGLTRNSGWQAVDAGIAARRGYQQQNGTVSMAGHGTREVPASSSLGGFGDVSRAR